ncbi:MAG: DUF3783 domain-containing protein [Lachnospiraceae bacterium]|jgi:hypothetical protein|nr:DUF3783 domain-containing protein [Lachnospiraceae bacterium]
MGKLQEVVLYYHADIPGENAPQDAGILTKKQTGLLKSVLIRMGVRIKNIGPDQISEKVGVLAGVPNCFPESSSPESHKNLSESFNPDSTKEQKNICQDVLVLYRFTDSRMDLLLSNLRKSGVPKIPLKAVVTPQNAHWPFYRLYEELKEEHETLHKTAFPSGGGHD